MPNPASIALLGPARAHHAAGFRAEVDRLLAHMQPGLVVDWFEPPIPSAAWDRPLAGVWFGGDSDDLASAAELVHFQNRKRPVLPLVGDLCRFRAHVPTSLHDFNGMVWDQTPLARTRAAGVVLGALGLAQSRRRVFISYRRDQSQGAATQLFLALSLRGYAVFLDTASVAGGLLFQPELWDAMADTDVVVFLATRDALGSTWVAQEIARANELGITVLHVIWPIPSGMAETDYKRALGTPADAERRILCAGDFRTPGTDLADAELKQATVDGLLHAVERLRAAAWSIRRSMLVEGLVARARTGPHASQIASLKVDALGPVELTTTQGATTILVPVLGPPGAQDYQDAVTAAQQSAGADARVLYRRLALHKRRLDLLDFLDDHLPAKTLAVEDLDDWLQQLGRNKP